jgi:hypothetical protein
MNAANFILLWFDKMPMAQETVAVISIFGGIVQTLSFGGYVALTAVRDVSLNNLKSHMVATEITEEV